MAPDRSRTHWTHYSLFAYVSVTEIQVSMYCVYKSLELNIWSTAWCFVSISPIKLHDPTARCVSINIQSTFLKQIRKRFFFIRKHFQNPVVNHSLCQSTLNLVLSLNVDNFIHSFSELSYPLSKVGHCVGKHVAHGQSAGLSSTSVVFSSGLFVMTGPL